MFTITNKPLALICDILNPSPLFLGHCSPNYSFLIFLKIFLRQKKKKKDSMNDIKKDLDKYFAIKSQMLSNKGIMKLPGRSLQNKMVPI